jgi:adenosine deaminase
MRGPDRLNSDDPAMFPLRLTGEYRLAAEHFGFTGKRTRGLAQNGFRYAFGEDGSSYFGSQ